MTDMSYNDTIFFEAITIYVQKRKEPKQSVEAAIIRGLWFNFT